jgi:hypothetical protein
MDTPSISQQRVTDLLARWSHSNDAALAELTPLVYEELRRLAHRHMGGHSVTKRKLIQRASRQFGLVAEDVAKDCRP